MTGYEIVFEPLLPLAALAGIGAAIAAILVLLMIRGVRGVALRLMASALLLAALANPVLEREEREALPGIVPIVIDESASQSLGDRSAQTEAAVAALKERIEALGGLDVRESRVRDGERGEGSALFSELTRLVDDVPPEQLAGAIFVTDGLVHDIPENAAALGFNAPIHALVSGTEDERDRRILLERAPRFAILGEEQSIDYRVIDPSMQPGARANVTLRVDGVEVATDEAVVGETHTIDVPIAHAGRTIVELEVEPGQNELALENNVAVAEIDVVREHLRVLLVSGEPHAG